MAPRASLLPLLLLLSTLALLASAHPTSTSPAPCASPTGFSNTVIRAPLPGSPTLQVSPRFLDAHLLFYSTFTNVQLSEAAVAAFCLDQCIAYHPDPHPANLSASASLPASYVSSRPGPCLSFTVDLGKLYPPDLNDTALRWYCEAFDTYLAENLSDYEPVDAPGSFLYSLGVNRACGGVRVF